MTATVLIVDDDPVQRRLLEAAVSRMGHGVRVVDGGRAALDLLASPHGREVSVVILDLVMPELDGIAVLRKMREAGIEAPVIVQTAQGGIDTVISAMRAGAFDFVVKPVSPERLQVSIANALKVEALEGEVKRIKRAAEGTLTFEDLVTRSERMERVIRLARRAADSTIPILIEGESGVGKELVARAIQGSGSRRARPFVTVNCGAIPENLVESILFGHEKGAFTGATERHAGKFVEANGGTLFLDEVGDLPLDVQVKLLRAVQEGEVDPVGGKRSQKVDIRIISATHRDLIACVKQGRFREDLYYRLNVFPIWVPPLRERKDDIPLLVRHFLARFAAEERRSQVRSVSGAALALLQAYDWPGNIRQLENAVFRAVVLCDGMELTPDEFPQIRTLVEGPDLARFAEALADRPSEPAPSVVPFPAEGVMHHPAPSATAYGQSYLLDGGGDVRPLTEIESEMIRFAIQHYNGQMSEVARRLGIGRSTLYRKLKEYGIEGAGEQQLAS